MTQDTVHSPTALSGLLGRRSVSPKRLQSPGPGSSELDLMLRAALRVPDHGSLRPWRVIEFRAAQRAALAQCFEDEKRRRDPLASLDDLSRARDHALRPPVLLAFVVAPQLLSKAPVREQWLTAGAALGNLLNAAHHLGYGAIVLSGDRCFDEVLLDRLGIGTTEQLAGFISIGRIAETPPPAHATDPSALRSCWRAAAAPAAQRPQPPARCAK